MNTFVLGIPFSLPLISSFPPFDHWLVIATKPPTLYAAPRFLFLRRCVSIYNPRVADKTACQLSVTVTISPTSHTATTTNTTLSVCAMWPVDKPSDPQADHSNHQQPNRSK